MAAPTLVAFAHAQGTGATAQTTASISWLAGDVLVALAGNEGAANGVTIALTTSGAGLAFGAALQSHSSSSSCAGYVWGCVASAGSSGTFTATISTGTTNTDIGVYIFRGSAGLGGSATTILARTVTLTPAASSAVVWGVWDFAAVALQGNTPTATSHNASTPGPSATPSDAPIGTNYTYYENEIDDGTGVTSYGIGGSTGGPFVVVAVEVKAGGAASPQPLISAPAFKVGAGPPFQPTVSYDSTPPAVAAAFVGPPPVVVDQSVNRAGSW